MSTSGVPMLDAQFYDGRKPVPESATLILSGSTVRVVGFTLAKEYQINQLHVSPRIGGADRFVSLPDGSQLQCADNSLLNRLPQEGSAEGLVVWLEQRWWVAATSLAIMITGILSGYFIGLPIAAEHISSHIPIAYERTLGDQTLTWLDEKNVFHASKLSPDMQKVVEEGFTKLHHGLPMDANYRLEFRYAPAIGPNAFALPGGTIVITDEMILLAQSPDEVQAVLAHEIGHVERRHALRSVLQNSAIAALSATLASDASSLSLAVTGLPVIIAQTKYSREFESEADDFAFDLLKKRNLSPELFASIMERLTEKHKKDERMWSFVSTHPITAERIARAREAARQ